jgi:hypothetical protein
MSVSSYSNFIRITKLEEKIKVSLEPQWEKRVKWLTQALLISGTLNIALIATFIYFVIQKEKTAISFELKPAEAALPPSNQEVLRAYSTLSFQDLLLRLEDREIIEEGYSKRDLALSCLVAFHHFDIEKALGGDSFQKRKIAFKSQDGLEMIDVVAFPGLSDAQFEALGHFAQVEKWPFRSKGLFFEIQRCKQACDPSLLDAFFLTSEFQSVSLLFARSEAPLDKMRILNLLIEGDWGIIEKFLDEQKRLQDLSANRRLAFLIDYIHRGSAIAAQLLLETDFEFACKRLDDPHVLLLLDLLKEKTYVLESFSKILIISPRSDQVWKKAAAKLYAFAGEEFKEGAYDHLKTLARFMPQAMPQAVVQNAANLNPIVNPAPVATPAPPAKQKKGQRIHRVQEGESLWKIAKKYRVSIEAIIKANHLETDKLRPGKELIIPESQRPQDAKGDTYKPASGKAKAR